MRYCAFILFLCVALLAGEAGAWTRHYSFRNGYPASAARTGGVGVRQSGVQSVVGAGVSASSGVTLGVSCGTTNVIVRKVKVYRKRTSSTSKPAAAAKPASTQEKRK